MAANGNKTAVILGGGVGGVVAARVLRKLLPPKNRIILVDREADHLFAPSLLWLMIGNRRPEKIVRPLDLLKKKGIEVVRGEIEKINPSEKSVRVGGRDISGDALIVSLGAELAPKRIPGLAEGGFNLYPVDGASSVRNALSEFAGSRVVLLTVAPLYKCPAAPYEAAMLVESHLRRSGLRPKVSVDLFAAEPGPMGTAGPEVSAAVRQLVESRGVRYHPAHQVTAVDPKQRRLTFANVTAASYDLLIYVPPHQSPSVVRDAGLVGDSGWVDTDRYTLETRFRSVYAIGDITAIPLKMGKPLPKAAVFAHAQAEVVAHNLAREWTGKGKPRTFDGVGQCFIETGGGRAGLGHGNFYAEPVPLMEMK